MKEFEPRVGHVFLPLPLYELSCCTTSGVGAALAPSGKYLDPPLSDCISSIELICSSLWQLNSNKCTDSVPVQWRVKDFPDGDANPKGGGANLLFGQLVHKSA